MSLPIHTPVILNSFQDNTGPQVVMLKQVQHDDVGNEIKEAAA
ncbi:MAG: hypothetical protein AAGL10_02825 [Pseudomonadota bacterium]